MGLIRKAMGSCPTALTVALALHQTDTTAFLLMHSTTLSCRAYDSHFADGVVNEDLLRDWAG